MIKEMYQRAAFCGQLFLFSMYLKETAGGRGCWFVFETIFCYLDPDESPHPYLYQYLKTGFYTHVENRYLISLKSYQIYRKNLFYNSNEENNMDL